MQPQSACIRPIAPSDTEAVLDFAARSFLNGSTLHWDLGLSLSAYRDAIREGVAANVAQGLSVMSEGPDGEIAGCLIACDILEQGPVAPLPELRPMQALFHQLEAEYRARRQPTPGEVAFVDMAAVAPAHAGKGLYRALRGAFHAEAKKRGFTRAAVVLSSVATQRLVIGRLGHRVAVRQEFATFEIDGKRPFSEIAEPGEIWLAEGSLD